jgi:hypothetical protein
MASSNPVNPTALSYLASRVKTLEDDTTPTTYKIEHTISEDLDAAIDDAYDDYLAILPAIPTPLDDNTEPVQVSLPAADSSYPRDNGKTLRFFNDTVATSPKYYEIKDGVKDGGGDNIITTLLGQEAISMIWNSTRSAWTCIPGIVNVKSKTVVEIPTSSA